MMHQKACAHEAGGTSPATGGARPSGARRAAHHPQRLALLRPGPAPWPAQRCRAAAPDGGEGAGGGGGDRSGVLARIEAAKKYKGGAPGGGGAPAPPAPPPAGAPQQQAAAGVAAGGATVEQQRAAWEAELRRKEAAARGDGAYSALLSQIEAGQRPQDEPPAGPGQPARPDFYTSPDGPDIGTLWENSQRTQTQSGRGSATEMASWMRGVYSDASGKLSEGLSQDLRPEEFTQQREARQRAMGADIITSAVNAAAIKRGLPSQAPATGAAAAAAAAAAEAAPAAAEAGAAAAADAPATGAAAAGAAAAGAAAAGGEEEGAAYQPKVTTWGVFPRPSNISEAFGGGRNIKPGQELETAEQKAKREAEYAAALERYKQKAGLVDLDPSVVAAAEKRYAQGAALMKAGQLAEALGVFNEVRETLPLKTRVGGLATLQAAICYDTLGDGQQAQALYKRLKGHPNGEVGRKARHLVFGFQAMDFLKTKNMSYAVDKKAYDKYFRRFSEGRVYVASEEERAADEAASRAATLLAAGVVLGPVAVFAAYALSH